MIIFLALLSIDGESISSMESAAMVGEIVIDGVRLLSRVARASIDGVGDRIGSRLPDPRIGVIMQMIPRITIKIVNLVFDFWFLGCILVSNPDI